ncbi:MAG: hypothetical protein ACYCTW_07035 [Sulfuricella sp.]
MTKYLAASVRARLLAVAKSQGADFNQVLVRFALERILYRLSHVASDLGGTCCGAIQNYYRLEQLCDHIKQILAGVGPPQYIDSSKIMRMESVFRIRIESHDHH